MALWKALYKCNVACNGNSNTQIKHSVVWKQGHFILFFFLGLPTIKNEIIYHSSCEYICTMISILVISYSSFISSISVVFKDHANLKLLHHSRQITKWDSSIALQQLNTQPLFFYGLYKVFHNRLLLSWCRMDKLWKQWNRYIVGESHTWMTQLHSLKYPLKCYYHKLIKYCIHSNHSSMINFHVYSVLVHKARQSALVLFTACILFNNQCWAHTEDVNRPWAHIHHNAPLQLMEKWII